MNAVFERKSVRQFIDKEIEKEKLVKIVHAGMVAPSAMNVKPCQFLIIEDPQIKEAISNASPYAKFARHSGALIIVLADRRKIIEMNKMWVQDASAATENILIQSVEEGLGGCWLGLYPNKGMEEEIAKICKLPPYITPFSIVALGYPKDNPKRKDSFDDSVIHYNLYSN